MRPPVRRALRQFLQTTTLHGFKYICSPFYIDRWGWVAWSVASACCAGALCAAVWARFLHTPTLLSLADAARAAGAPLVAVCPAPHRAATFLADHLSLPTDQALMLQALFYNLLRGKYIAKSQLQYLNKLLNTHHLTLAEALLRSAPQCKQLLKICRWRNQVFACEGLFKMELTQWGVCCVATAEQLNSKTGAQFSEYDPDLDLLLECSDGTISNGCEFYTKYKGEEWVSPVSLSVGYSYVAQVTYSAVRDSTQEKLFDTQCVSEASYTMTRCLIECKELKCGCSDPLRPRLAGERAPQPCSVLRLNCLRSFKLIEEACACGAACRNIATDTALEGSRMDQLQHTFDPMFASVNVSTSSALTVRARGARRYELMYTETWWSLLSTLGGVFNMSLGVGLFSTLELLFFLFFKLPVAIRRSAELHHPTTR